MPFKKVYIKSATACRQGPPRGQLLEKRRSPPRGLVVCRPSRWGQAHYAIRHPAPGGSCSLPISQSAPATSPKVFPQYESAPQNTRDFSTFRKKTLRKLCQIEINPYLCTAFKGNAEIAQLVEQFIRNE